MEISFANESIKTPLRNEPAFGRAANPSVTREQRIDSVSGNIRAGIKSREADPDELLEQTVEASAQGNAIDNAYDFNMARVMELLSDPLLQEDAPE